MSTCQNIQHQEVWELESSSPQLSKSSSYFWLKFGKSSCKYKENICWMNTGTIKRWIHLILSKNMMSFSLLLKPWWWDLDLMKHLKWNESKSDILYFLAMFLNCCLLETGGNAEILHICLQINTESRASQCFFFFQLKEIWIEHTCHSWILLEHRVDWYAYGGSLFCISNKCLMDVTVAGTGVTLLGKG